MGLEPTELRWSSVLDLVPETGSAVFVLFGAEGNFPANMPNEGTRADRSFIGHGPSLRSPPNVRPSAPEVDGRNRGLRAESGWKSEGHV